MRITGGSIFSSRRLSSRVGVIAAFAATLILAACCVAFAAEHSRPEYSRSAFRHWVDADRDCRNTRHETLLAWNESDAPSFTNERECLVSAGLWSDP